MDTEVESFLCTTGSGKTLSVVAHVFRGNEGGEKGYQSMASRCRNRNE